MLTSISILALALLSSSSNAQSTVTFSSSSSGTGTVAPAATAVATSTVGNATVAAASAPAVANPLIPSTVSPGCQSFLTSLNADPVLSSCTTSALSTLSAFIPTLSQTTFTASSSDITAALSSYCATGGCSSSAVRTALNQFNGNCSAELTAGNSVILNQYDTLYVLTPLTEAICSTDSNGAYCLNDIVTGNVPAAAATTNATTPLIGVNGTESTNATATASSTPVSRVVAAKAAAFDITTYAGDALSPQKLFSAVTSSASRLVRRAGIAILAATSTSSSTVDTVLPNAATWSGSNVPFMFLSPNMSSTILCTPCTKTILAGYVAWEAHIPYALGLANSPLLKGQGSLWTGIGQVCGSGFLASTAQQAGQSQLASGATVVGGAKVAGTVGAFVAAVGYLLL